MDSKKVTIIHVMRVLYNYSSAEFPVSQTAIVNYLNDIGISCTRKTVGRNINCLVDAGVPIKRKHAKNGGYYYDHENDKFLVRINKHENGEGND